MVTRAAQLQVHAAAQEWTEAFDSAYLGTVEEEEGELSSGFGGAIRKRKWENLVVEFKKFHRREEELYGLLMGASPTLGVCASPYGQPRDQRFCPKRVSSMCSESPLWETGLYTCQMEVC